MSPTRPFSPAPKSTRRQKAAVRAIENVGVFRHLYLSESVRGCKRFTPLLPNRTTYLPTRRQANFLCRDSIHARPIDPGKKTEGRHYPVKASQEPIGRRDISRRLDVEISSFGLNIIKIINLLWFICRATKRFGASQNMIRFDQVQDSQNVRSAYRRNHHRRHYLGR
jgi:hypothetical protein